MISGGEKLFVHVDDATGQAVQETATFQTVRWRVRCHAGAVADSLDVDVLTTGGNGT
jgi:hypothetical protein